MSQRSRSGGGTGRRPKDVRTGGGRPGQRRGGPATNRVTGSRVRPGTAAAGGQRYNPRLLGAAIGGGVLVFAALVFGVLGGSGGGSRSSTTPGGSDGAGGAPAGCPTAQPAALARGETRTVTIQTAKGNIVITIKGSSSPIAAGNFVALASCGYYDGVTFHRLVPGFVIQGGDRQHGLKSSFDASLVGQGGPGYSIADEPVTTTYHRGTVAMARSSQPNSQGSQFFIVLSDSAATALKSANPGYAIIGEVSSGMNVVDAIAAMPNSGGQENLATDPVAMDHVTVSNP